MFRIENIRGNNRLLTVGILALSVLVGLTAVDWRMPLFFAVSIGGIALLLLFLQYPWWATYFLVLSFPLISAVPRGSLIPIMKLDEVFILLGVVVAILSSQGKNKLLLTKIDLAYLAAVVLGTILPIIGNVARGQSPELLEVIALLKPYLLFRLVFMTIVDERRLSRVLRLLIMGNVLIALIAVLQVLQVESVNRILATVFYETTGYNSFSRVSATLGYPGGLGGYSAAGAIVWLAVLRSPNRLIPFRLSILGLGASIISLLLSGSAASIGALVMVGILWFSGDMLRMRFSRRQMFLLLGVSIVGIVVFVTLGSQILEDEFQKQAFGMVFDRATGNYYQSFGLPRTLWVRFYLIRYLIADVMMVNPIDLITGYGNNAYATSLLPWGTPEVGYMAMLFFYGFGFLISYVALYAYLWHKTKQLQKSSRGQRLQSLYLLSFTLQNLVVVIVIMNFVRSAYSEAGTVHYFWIIVGCWAAQNVRSNFSGSDSFYQKETLGVQQ